MGYSKSLLLCLLEVTQMSHPSLQKHQDDVFSQAKSLRYLVVTLRASFTQNFRATLDVL